MFRTNEYTIRYYYTKYSNVYIYYIYIYYIWYKGHIDFEYDIDGWPDEWYAGLARAF